MPEMDSFLRGGFTALADALHEASAQAGLHLRPASITRRMARFVRVRLRLLGRLYRQLVLLLAVTLDLPPLKPAAPHEPGPRSPAPHASFRLLPSARYDAEALEALKARGTARRDPHDTAAIPLIHRLETLAALIADPWRHARRMARIIERLRRRGELRPFALPLEQRHRLPAHLGLLAGVLTPRVNEALRAFFAPGPDPPPCAAMTG